MNDLTFDCNFESGNIGNIIKISDIEYDLSIRGDTNNERHKIWFYFRIKNTYMNQKIILHINNYSKDKSLFSDGFTPVVRSTSRWRWERIPSNQIDWFCCNRHKKRYCLTILFQFDSPTDEYYFAYSFPYSYTKLQKYLISLDELNISFFKREVLCLTSQGRNLDLIKITSPNNFNNSNTRVVFFTARVHPGETPSSFVCHGIIEFLISKHPFAELLRDNTVFFIVPMLNPDGVFIGNYRSSSNGYDLNRQWKDPEIVNEPTILAVKNLLLSIPNLDVYIDMHAHSTSLNNFMYLNTDPVLNEDDKDLFYPRHLAIRSKHFSYSKSRTCNALNKNGTGRRVMGDLIKTSSCYTFEVSFFCSLINGVRSQPYSELSYLQLGREVAIALVDFYKLESNYAHSMLEEEIASKNKTSSKLIEASSNSADSIENVLNNKPKSEINNEYDSEEEEDLIVTSNVPNLIITNFETPSIPLVTNNSRDFKSSFRESAYHTPTSILSPPPNSQHFDFNLTIPDINIPESELIQDPLVVNYGGNSSTWKNTINHFGAPRKLNVSPPLRPFPNAHSFSSFSVNNTTAVVQSAMNLSYFKPVQNASVNAVERPNVIEKIITSEKGPRIPMSLKPFFSSSPPVAPIELRKPGHFPTRPLPISNKLPANSNNYNSSLTPIIKSEKFKSIAANRTNKDSALLTTNASKAFANRNSDLSFRQVFEKSKLLSCDSSWKRDSSILPPVNNRNK